MSASEDAAPGADDDVGMIETATPFSEFRIEGLCFLVALRQNERKEK